MQQNNLLELEFKAKLFAYVQWVKIFISILVFLQSTYFLILNDYNYFLPEMCIAILVSSLIGIVVVKKFDKKFKYIPYVISVLEFFIFLYYIYISKFAYNTLIFWLSGLMILTYFFTNFRFSIFQLVLTFLFISIWPNSFYDTSEAIYHYHVNYDNSFKVSAIGFLIFIFLIFYFFEKIKNFYLENI